MSTDVIMPALGFDMTEGLLAPSKVDFFHSEPTEYQQADQPDDDDF